MKPWSPRRLRTRLQSRRRSPWRCRPDRARLRVERSERCGVRHRGPRFDNRRAAGPTRTPRRSGCAASCGKAPEAHQPSDRDVERAVRCRADPARGVEHVEHRIAHDERVFGDWSRVAKRSRRWRRRSRASSRVSCGRLRRRCRRRRSKSRRAYRMSSFIARSGGTVTRWRTLEDVKGISFG